MKLFQKCLVFLSVVTLLQLLVFLSVLALTLQVEREADAAAYSNAVLTSATSISRGMQDYGSSIVLFLATRNREWIDRFTRLGEELPKEMANLEKKVPKDSDDYKDLEKASRELQYIVQIISESKEAVELNLSYVEIVGLKQKLKLGLVPRIKELVELLNQVQNRHSNQAVDLPKIEQEKKNRFKLLVISGFLLNLTATFLMVLGFNQGITKRISIIADNFAKYKLSNTLNPPQKGSDEISFLDKSFHELAVAKEEIEKLKQEFVSIIGHDIRAPLTSIKGCLQLLVDGKLGEITDEAKKYVGIAGQESDRLINLTGDLLDIAKIESGHIVLDKRTVSCSDLLDRAVAAVKPLAEAKSITIDVVPTQLNIVADPDRVCQILVNYLSNAIKYSDSQTHVTVSAKADDSSIRFSVDDQGRGIPNEFVAGIFDRFKQVRSEDAKEGTGLGLAICKLLAEAHGGSVGVETALAKGSKFWLRLPAPQDEL